MWWFGGLGGVAGAGRAGDRGRRWVVRFPPWLRVGLAGEVELVRRGSAVGLYAAFGPLAFLVELAYGAWSAHPAVLAGATMLLVA